MGGVIDLAIVGSQGPWDDEYLVREIIRWSIELLDPYQVISGGAYGVDEWAYQIATEQGYPVDVIVPKFNRWSPEGYQDRNKEIARRCDTLLCIRSDRSTTYGSGWTADYAEEIGKKVHRLTL